MAKTNNSCPLERQEQATFVQWLELQGLLFSATAQSTYTTSWNQKRLNHATGLRKGLPDIIVVISPERDIQGIGCVLFIEMKRKKGGVISPEQKLWIKELDLIDNVGAFVCRGAEQAIETVSTFIKPVDNSVF